MAKRRLIVDGLNVIGSRPDGWWRDRDGAIRALVRDLEAYAADTGEAVTAVLDGRPFDLERPRGGRVQVLFAARSGRDAADDEIARIAEESREGDVRVVTSDRPLAARVREAGAEVVPSGSFRRRLDRIVGNKTQGR